MAYGPGNTYIGLLGGLKLVVNWVRRQRHNYN